MSTIMLQTIGSVLALTDEPIIPSGGDNNDYIKINFDSTWNGFAKIAIFYQQKGEYFYSIVQSDDTALIPTEIVNNSGAMYLGIVGVKDNVTKTTNVLRYKIVGGSLDGFTIEDPPEDIYKQILQAISNYYESMDQQFTDLATALEQSITEWKTQGNFNDATIAEDTGWTSAKIDAEINARLQAIGIRFNSDIDRIEIYNPAIKEWVPWQSTGVVDVPATITVNTTTLNGQSVTCAIGDESYETVFVNNMATFKVYTAGDVTISGGGSTVTVNVALGNIYEATLEERTRLDLIIDGVPQEGVEYNPEYFVTSDGYFRITNGGSGSKTVSTGLSYTGDVNFLVGKKVGIEGDLFYTDLGISVNGQNTVYNYPKVNANGVLSLANEKQYNTQSETIAGQTIAYADFTKKLENHNRLTIGCYYDMNIYSRYTKIKNLWIE